MSIAFNPKSEVDRGDLTQSAGRECHSSGFAVSSDTPQPSSSHPGSASCAISSPPTSEFGFKEWAVICDTLGAGRQSVILRKGGIHEGRDGFSFKHAEFFLFPTLFHEQIAKTTLPASTPIPVSKPNEIAVRQFARLEWTATITDLDIALSLRPYHVWTDDVVRERFHYDEAPGLHLAFLRIYRCDPEWSFPDDPKYGGCRSWITIPHPPAATNLVPVLPDDEHQERSASLKAALGQSR